MTGRVIVEGVEQEVVSIENTAHYFLRLAAVSVLVSCACSLSWASRRPFARGPRGCHSPPCQARGFRRSDVNDRIAGILCPGAAAIIGVSQPLILQALCLLTLFAMPGVNANHGSLAAFREPARATSKSLTSDAQPHVSQKERRVSFFQMKLIWFLTRSVQNQVECGRDRRSALPGNDVPDVLRRFHHAGGAGAL